MSGSAGTKNKGPFARYVKAMSPFRALRKVKDLYVRNLLDCSGRVSTYSAAGCSNMGGAVSELPRSFSCRSSSGRGEEYERRMTELIKATIGRMPPPTKVEGMVPVRSYSVGNNMRKIDEEEPFEEDVLKGSKGEKFPRSKSYARPRKWVGTM